VGSGRARTFLGSSDPICERPEVNEESGAGDRGACDTEPSASR
jgi:hypothetical protein